MPGFNDVVEALDRILGPNSAGNHGEFWRGKTRDEFVAHSVFGFPVVEVGDSANSNIFKALTAQAPFGSNLTPPTPGAFLPRMPAYLPPSDPADFALIQTWIDAGCPEVDTDDSLGLASAEPADDNAHVRYWREIDFFFLPRHSSSDTFSHVVRWHFATMELWKNSKFGNGSDTRWNDHIADPQNIASFEYLRLHQRRLISAHYGASIADVHDSLWKFGADLLPRDPSSGADPEHRMDSPESWFAWAPYIEMSLLANDMNDVDLALSRGWQIGIAGDGLLRRDRQRPTPIEIPEFDASDPNLRDQVITFYQDMEPGELIEAMVLRARTVLPN